MHKTAEHTWSGDLVEHETGKKVHIGTWSLPKEIGNLKSSHFAFIEYYWNPAGPTWKSCSDLSKAHVVFGPPRSTDYDGTYGAVNAPVLDEGSDCIGAESDHHVSLVMMKLRNRGPIHLVGFGYEISRGFISNKTK